MRALTIVRVVSFVSGLLWLFMVASLVGEVQAGITNVVPFLMAVLICLVGALVGAFVPVSGGLLLVVGAIALPVGAIWTDGGPFGALMFAPVAAVIGIALLVTMGRAPSRLARQG